MNPYLAGFLLGCVILASFYFTGRGLGASGAVKSTLTAAIQTVAPEHVENSDFYSSFVNEGKSTLDSWLVYEILGLLVGGLISGILAGRVKLVVEHSPKITKRKRLIMATIGGIFLGFGAALGRGCTSGAALSGMAVLSTAGFISFLAIFGTGFLVAWFFRKFWI